jgi:hypothetical protein
MPNPRLWLVALLAMFALGSLAVSAASAAPKSTSVLLLSVESLPVAFSTLLLTISSELMNAAGSITATRSLAQGNITSETGGLIDLLFAGTECNTGGDPSGEVLFPHTPFHFVHDESSEKGAALLYEIPEFTMFCPGGAQVRLKGTLLSLVTNAVAGSDILSLVTITTHCSGTTGEPADIHYWTSLLSSELRALLLMQFGGGFRKACLQLNGTTGVVNISVAKMIEVMNP